MGWPELATPTIEAVGPFATIRSEVTSVIIMSVALIVLVLLLSVVVVVIVVVGCPPSVPPRSFWSSLSHRRRSLVITEFHRRLGRLWIYKLHYNWPLHFC